MLRISSKEDLNLITPEIKKIYIEKSFKDNLENLPVHLKSIQIGCGCKLEIGCEFLPENLETLHLGFLNTVNLHQLSNLPQSLRNLNIGGEFNQPLDKYILPQNLKTLYLGWEFNQKIKKGDLPDSLEELCFSHKFNQEIEDGSLSNSIKYLYFGGCFKQKLSKQVLPRNLLHLHLGSFLYPHEIIDILPDSLKEITICENYKGKLPLHLKINFTKRVTD